MNSKDANAWALAILAVEADAISDLIASEFDNNEFAARMFTAEEKNKISAAAQEIAFRIYKRASKKKIEILLGKASPHRD